jgi:hypothetical protein
VLSIGALTPPLGLTGATTAVIVTALAAIALAVNARSASGPANAKHVPATAK